MLGTHGYNNSSNNNNRRPCRWTGLILLLLLLLYYAWSLVHRAVWTAGSSRRRFHDVLAAAAAAGAAAAMTRCYCWNSLDAICLSSQSTPGTRRPANVRYNRRGGFIAVTIHIMCVQTPHPANPAPCKPRTLQSPTHRPLLSITLV